MPELLERLQSMLKDRYAIESEIGRGSMATVFLTEDLKHRRKVAIKVLHPTLTATLGSERFLQEIEIVAGLQHPHILPLYDSGEADGLLYYVMPYAAGESLKHRLGRERQLAVHESIRIAVEVADAIDYAHRQGVVHRDIKPGNILLAEGHAVLADFGIARAIEAARQDRITRTGLGVGTPLYASPEQAMGDTLDGRTDIYSLGCVLYEMLAGEPPLTGSTPQMIRARRLADTPTALHPVRDTVPPALDRVIARALAPVPADRYATASQFGQALQAVLTASTPAAQTELAPIPASLDTRRLARPRTPGRAAWLRLMAVPALAIGLLVAVVMLWPPSGWFGRGSPHFATSNIRRITTAPGIEFQPALSPDGNYVAYVVGPSGGRRVLLRSTHEAGFGGASLLTDEIAGDHLYPSWSTDGVAVRFLARLGDDSGWRQVGTLGGPVRSIRTRSGANLFSHAWSRDGTRMAFTAGLDSIFASDEEGGDIQLLGVQPENPHLPHSLAWSPDGRWIAYVNQNVWWTTRYNVHESSIWLVSSEGGEPIRVTDEASMNQSPQWLPDSRNLLFLSNRGGTREMYVIGVGAEGPRESPRIVPGAADAHTISLSADGRRLALSKYVTRRNIWSIAIDDHRPATLEDAETVTTGNQVVHSHSVSPDGEWITFAADIQGDEDIYRQRLDGGQPQLIVDLDGTVYGPAWSPDGTEVAFSEKSEEGTVILTAPADGGASTQVTTFGTDENPAWSPDGLTIVFDSRGPLKSGPNRLWAVSRDGLKLPWGEPVQLTNFDCAGAEWAPSANRLVCMVFGEGVVVLIAPNGEVVRRYDPSENGLTYFRWPEFSTDGSRIYVFGREENGRRGIWWIPTRGGDATKAVAFDGASRPVNETFTVGAERLYLTVEESESDIWVMDFEW